MSKYQGGNSRQPQQNRQVARANSNAVGFGGGSRLMPFHDAPIEDIHNQMKVARPNDMFKQMDEMHGRMM